MLRTTEKLLIPTGILFTRRQAVPAGDDRIRPRAVHRQDHRGRYMGIPIPANPSGHGRDGLYIKTSYGITLGYFRIESILPIPERISVEEREQCLTV